MRRSLEPQESLRLLDGGPLVLVTTRWRDQTDVMPAIWTTPLSREPPLVGVVVHPSRHTHDMIRFSEQFPIVEVDSTYYGLPSERNAALWVERTPDDFVFDIKSYALFTHHPAAVRSLPKDLRESLPPALGEKRNLYYRDAPPELRDELWGRFNSALLPLDSAGKLGTVLFQFPPWFLPGRDSADYILEAKQRLGQYRMAVEFRNDRWLSDRNQERTLKLLSDNAISYVCVDEPQGFRSSVPPLVAVTAPVALVRMHGRNAETWEKKGIGASDRFDYLYRDEELEEWLPIAEWYRGR